MASNDRNPADDEAVEGSWSPKRSSKASSDKDASDKSGTPDPDVLVDDIERTREELAETLDAIAEKVSPKRVVGRTKKAAKDGVTEAVESVKQTAAEAAGKAKESASHAAEAAKETASHAAEAAKETASHAAEAAKEGASHAAEAAKEGVAAVKEKVDGDDDPRDGALLAGAVVPVEPAPTPGALADASVVAVEPAGTDTPSYGSSLPPASPSRAPMLAGAGAALLVLLVVLKRRGR